MLTYYCSYNTCVTVTIVYLFIYLFIIIIIIIICETIFNYVCRVGVVIATGVALHQQPERLSCWTAVEYQLMTSRLRYRYVTTKQTENSLITSNTLSSIFRQLFACSKLRLRLSFIVLTNVCVSQMMIQHLILYFNLKGP